MNASNKVFRIFSILAVLAMVFAQVSPALAQAGNPEIPYETELQVNEDGRSVTTLKGFDLNEWGGTTDSACHRTELDEVELREEVGSADEACAMILEWSLKNMDQTIVSGFYSFEPREWMRLTYEQANGPVRFVGTMHYVPLNWNAHMLAADMAGDWQQKNPGLTTYVGLSPNDSWVQGLWSDAEGVDSPVASQPAAPTNTPIPTVVDPTTVTVMPRTCEGSFSGVEYMLNVDESKDVLSTDGTYVNHVTCTESGIQTTVELVAPTEEPEPITPAEEPAFAPVVEGKDESATRTRREVLFACDILAEQEGAMPAEMHFRGEDVAYSCETGARVHNLTWIWYVAGALFLIAFAIWLLRRRRTSTARPAALAEAPAPETAPAVAPADEE